MRWVTLLLLLATPAMGQVGNDANAGHVAHQSDIVLSAPLTGAGSLPACNAADNCAMRCAVGLGAATSSQWGCETPTGNVVVTNGAGDGTADCLGITGGCIKIANSEPSIAAATAATAGLDSVWVSPHTIRVVGFTDFGLHAAPRMFSHGPLNTAGFELRVSSTTGVCTWSSAAASVAPAESNGLGSAWSVITCTQSADNSRSTRANGDTTTDATSLTVVAPTSYDVVFGDRQAGARPMNGYLRAVYIYSAAKTAASDTAFEQTLFGTQTAAGGVTTVRDTTRPCAHGTTYDVMGPDMPCVDQSTGLFVSEATTNGLQNSLDFTAWTVAGTPIVTADQDSGPLADYNVGAEADKLEDDSASAFEWIYQQATTSTVGDWTASVWAKAGTSTEITMRFVTDGTGTVTCTTDTITSTWDRYACTKTIGGTPTYVRVNIYPTDLVAASTGNIYISGAQLEQSSYATPICLSTGAATTCDADQTGPPTNGWPTAQGSISFTFTPFADDAPVTAYLVDYFSATEGVAIHVASSGILVLTTLDSTGSDALGSSALTWVAGTPYAIKATWGGGVSQLYRDGILLATSTTAKSPTGGENPAGLLSTTTSTLVNMGSIKNLEIRR